MRILLFIFLIRFVTVLSVGWDSVRVLTRMLSQARERFDYLKILFVDHSKRSKRRMLGVECLYKFMDSEQHIEGNGKERELLFPGGCKPFCSHASGIYPEGKITSAFIHEIMQ